ncbi:MAG: carbohydrate-binding domain-containing protein [Bacteroidales bacterium]|nr:carbohydrate-binding domain-containing protein [Bacteroidales bacterium]
MKTHRLLLAAAATAFTVFGACNPDSITIEEVQSPEEQESEEPYSDSADLSYVSFSASLSGLDSKAYISDNNLSPAWSSDDKIAVFDDAKRAFSVTDCSGSNATLEGSISGSFSGTLGAVYPYSAAGSRSSSNVSVTVPSSQKVSSGYSIDEDALVSVALCDNNAFAFKNVCGIVRLQITDSDISSVVLTAAGGEALAGTALVEFSSGEVLSSSSSSSSVTLSAADGGVLAAGVYYIAVLPVSLSSGLSLSFENSEGSTAQKSSSNQASVARASGINLGDVTSGLEWVADETGGGVIASDDNDPNDDDIVSNTTFDRTVKVVFSTSGSASVKNATGNISAVVNGNDVTVTNSGKENVIYELSGTTTDGFFKLYSSKKQAIVLNGASITNKNGAAINNQSKKRTFVVVKGSNSLSDGSSYTDTPAEEDEKAAFFSEGQLVFSGSGSLTVTATGKAGITSDDYVRFMSSPTIKVNSSAGHGVRGKDYILVSNGSITASVSANMKKGFSSDSLVAITGGTTDITVTGGVAYDSEDGEYKGTAGIKADYNFTMSGGSLTIKNSGKGGKGISAGDYDFDSVNHVVGDSYITGGTVNITTTGTESNDETCKGIKIGWVTKNGSGDHATVTGNAGNLYITGGKVNVTCSKAECIEAKGNLTISGGEVYASSSGDDAINSQGELNITGGYVYAFSSANDAIDANHDLKLSGGCTMAVTTKGSPEVALDANTEDRYKLYIYSGATVVAYGGLESGYSASQSIYSMSATAGSWNALHNGSSYLCAFKLPSGASSVAVSAPSLSKGYKGVSVSGTTCANGTWATSGISGGSSVSLSTYSGGSSGGGRK